MRVAIYARVSTKDKGQDVENQLDQLRAYAKLQGWEGREFVDHETGKHSDRAQFRAMFAAAKDREIDMVLFWALNRFTREGVLPTLQHLNTLSGYGVGFYSLREPYLDSCGLFKDAIIAILSTLAKQEIIQISERTKAGLARARTQGRVGGRPRKVFSHDRAQQLRKKGMSWRQVGRELKVPESTLRLAFSAAQKT